MTKARRRGGDPTGAAPSETGQAGADPAETRTDTATGVAVLEDSPFPGDLAADLAAKPARARPGPTVYLVAGVIAVAGFIGGIQAHKTWGGEKSAGGGQTAAGRQGGGFGGGSGFGGGGAAGGVTAGTVTKVKDGVITLETSDGRSVEVKTSGDTEVTLTENGSAEDLESGTSVVVRGETGADGTVTATSVSEGSGGSGFPGGGMQAPSGN